MIKISNIKLRNISFFLIITLFFAFLFPTSVFADVNGHGGDNNAGNKGNKDNLYAHGKGWRVYLADKSGNNISLKNKY